MEGKSTGGVQQKKSIGRTVKVLGLGKFAASVLFGVVWGLVGAAAAFTMGASLALVAGLILLIFLRAH